jgi:hypothetical protein
MSGDGVIGPGGCRLLVEDALSDFGDFLMAYKGRHGDHEGVLSAARSDVLVRAGRPFGAIDLQVVSALRVRSYVTDRGGRTRRSR